MSSSSGKATASAHPNLALVKYWGKRDARRLLPWQSSLSVTAAPLEVRATVAFEGRGGADEVQINGREAGEGERRRVLSLVEVVRGQRPGLGRVRVVTSGNFPASAGMASSAAAFAALALAVRRAAGLPAETAEVSRLARLGSGSACRSVQGGFCVWRRGEDPEGSDSFAEQIFAPGHWPQFRVLFAILSREEKEVSSRDGMQQTVETSPFYPAWIEEAERMIGPATELIGKRDLAALGELSELNAWRMHATALGASPPLCYLKPSTLELLLALPGERKRGLPVWFTLDAGPNPALLTDAGHASAVEALARRFGAQEVAHCHPGGDAATSTEHLF